jgi:hypothetical protein
MEPRVDIRRLHLRYIERSGTRVDRSRLDDVAVRLLPSALERALDGVDDGAIVILRKVAARVRLHEGVEATWARVWAESMASEIRRLIAELRTRPSPAESMVGVAFAGPVDALARYAIAAVEGQLGKWYWSDESNTLKAIQRALSALPGVDGQTHAYAASPLPPQTPTRSEAVEWALRAAGASLPELLRVVNEEGRLGAVLAEVRPELAAWLAASLCGEPFAAEESAAVRSQPSQSFVEATAWLVSRAFKLGTWPASSPRDPRNVLALLALALAERPQLRGAAGLAAAVRAVLEDRLSIPGAREPAEPTHIPELSSIKDKASEVSSIPIQKAGVHEPPNSSIPSSPSSVSGGAIKEGTPPEPLIAPVRGAEQEARLIPLSPASRMTEAEPVPRPLEPPEAAEPTRFGGLLFLIPLIEGLGIPSAILEEPAIAVEPGLGAVLYMMVCQLVPDAEADPVALALGGLEEPVVPATALDPERASAVLRAGARVAEASARLPFIADPDDEPRLRNRAATSRVARSAPLWLQELSLHFALRLVGALRARIELELPLDALLDLVIARAGKLKRTLTHLDLMLPLDSVSVEIRRGALDINPGWVPFLGRVVSIHYV